MDEVISQKANKVVLEDLVHKFRSVAQSEQLKRLESDLRQFNDSLKEDVDQFKTEFIAHTQQVKKEIVLTVKKQTAKLTNDIIFNGGGRGLGAIVGGKIYYHSV